MGQLHNRIHEAVDAEEDGIILLTDSASIYAVQSGSDVNDEYFIIMTDTGNVCAQVCKGFRYSKDDDCGHLRRLAKHLKETPFDLSQGRLNDD